MKTVKTMLNEYQDTQTAPCQILNQWPCGFSSKNVFEKTCHVQSSGGAGVTSSSNEFQRS